jgi:Putative transposase DNA-binding domain
VLTPAGVGGASRASTNFRQVASIVSERMPRSLVTPRQSPVSWAYDGRLNRKAQRALPRHRSRPEQRRCSVQRILDRSAKILPARGETTRRVSHGAGRRFAQGCWLGVMRVVPERYCSRTCSACRCIPASRPKGLGALGVRQWRCDACGTLHDRDVNGVRNIEIAGAERRPRQLKSPPIKGGEDVNCPSCPSPRQRVASA